ncbi:tetraspanin-33-like [Mya arenaria]|uniref:tetraspanin-33-like n=1 Tax=Mya arenaria TaxID=6604 RepID=UPI0022E58D63|nr:tetraspanin-33-like [Mya arenaria]XP_052773952.1 tetraspanin-33-like [Mya arenaria]
MACCPKGDTFVSPCLKYAIFFFNFVLWLCGVLMIAIGVWAFIEKNKYYYQQIETIYDIFLDLSILLIIVGGFIFIVSFAGCVGALRENLCFLRVFYGSIILVVIAEVTVAVLAFVYKDSVHKVLTGILEEGMIQRYQDDEDALMDWAQENIKCCGIKNYKDWNMNMYFNCTKENPSGLRCGVPYSCCRDPDAMSPGIINILCGANALNDSATTFSTTSKIYTMGCVDTFVNLAESNLPIIGAIVLGLGVPQLLGICLGRLLDGQIQDQMVRYRRANH